MSEIKVEPTDLESIADCVDDLHELLKEGTMSERRTFIKGFVKEVKVTGNDVLLTYALPLSPEGISEERIGVLSTVQYGGPFWTRTRDPSLIRTVL